MINFPVDVNVACDSCGTTKEFPVTEYMNQSYGIEPHHLEAHGWADDSRGKAEGDHFCVDCAFELGIFDIEEVQERYDNHLITIQALEASEHYHYCEGTIYDQPMTECDECGEVFPKADEFCPCQDDEDEND